MQSYLIFLWCLTLIRFGNYFFPLLDISFLQQTTLSSSLYRLRQHFEFDSTNFSINLKDFLFWFIMNCITVGHIFITAIRDDRPQSRPHYAKSEGHTTYQICKKKIIGVAPPSRFRKMSFNRIGHGRCIPNNVYSVLTLNLGLEASSFLSFSSKSTNLRDTFSTIPCKSLYSA